MKVNSSNIDEIEHDGSSLTVKFKSGATYTYAEVPSQVFDQLVAANSDPSGSVGRTFHEFVQKGGFETKRLD